MSKFQIYDVVKVARPPRAMAVGDGTSMNRPDLGDIGVIVMAYEPPCEGYTVESVLADGTRNWLHDFSADELEKA